jgi:N-acetylgalactosamine-6-sulfatase
VNRLPALGACLLVALSGSAPAATPPNIVFLFADDLGWGDLSCYGKQRVRTPRLDRLASEGTLFTQFYVAGSVCSPSRTGIMTGHYPARHRVFGHFARHESNEKRGMPDALDPAVTTLTDLLRAAGYRTGHFGKWHLGDIEAAEYGVDRYRTESWSNVPDRERLDIWGPDNRHRCTAEILDAALEFIRQDPSRPFYVNAWFSDPHATLNPSPEQLRRVGQFKPRGVGFHGVAQVYYACVVEMDRQVGRFLDELDKLGLADDTLVIFSSDNGPEDFQIGNAAHSGVGDTGPFRGRKRAIYEGGIRVPFLVRWPGQVPAGRVNDSSVVAGVDFIPTLCALAGVDAGAVSEPDGEDMSDVLLGSDRKRRRPLFWEWRYRVFGRPLDQPPRLAIRDGDWKLLMNPDGSRLELYHIPRDPMELDNQAANRPELADKLSARLLEWNATLPDSPIEDVAGRNHYPFPRNQGPKQPSKPR